VTRRLVQLLVLFALAAAPFGRIGISQAMARHMPTAMIAHCAGQPMPEPARGHRMAVDCMIACAAMAPAPAPFALPPPAVVAAPVGLAAGFPAGVRPEADPPPPRLA
jgi:hypothetical protein